LEVESPAADGVLLGVDIGGTKTALLAFDIASGEPVGEKWYGTDCTIGPDRMIERIYTEAEALLGSHGRPFSQIQAIGVGVPGRVDDRGHVLDAGNLTGWNDIPLRERLAGDLKVAAWVDQDANLGALGERWRGCAQSMGNFVFLALGTGVGAGLVLDGKLYRGARHAAGEVGDIVPDRSKLGAGSAERNLGGLIGGRTIRAKALRAVGEWLTAAESLQQADWDDRLEALAGLVSDYVALTVINISTLLDPEAIIFGGGTASAGAALLDRVHDRLEGELRVMPNLVLSALGEHAQVYGAIWGAMSARKSALLHAADALNPGRF
jgi:glucokinase